MHYGHLYAAEQVIKRLKIDEIIFIPSGNPPLKHRQSQDAIYRYEMVKLAVSTNSKFRVSDIEINQRGKSYSIFTVQRLLDKYKGHKLFFIVGIDTFMELDKWYKPELLTDLIDFIIMSRQGFYGEKIEESLFVQHKIKDTKDLIYLKLNNGKEAIFVKINSLNISSTEIRKLVRKNKSIKYLLPEKVEGYISKHKLYS